MLEPELELDRRLELDPERGRLDDQSASTASCQSSEVVSERAVATRQTAAKEKSLENMFRLVFV